MLVTGSLLCYSPHLGYIYLTKNFTCVFSIGLGFVFMERKGPVQFVIARQILWMTIKFIVVVTMTELLITILLVTRFSQLLGLQL